MKTKKKKAPTRKHPKRHYSRAFPIKGNQYTRYLLDKIPPPFWRKVQAHSKKTGVSLRAFILQQLDAWVAGRLVFQGPEPPIVTVLHEGEPVPPTPDVDEEGTLPPVPCSHCQGTGELTSGDPAVGVAPCPFCDGRGVVPAVA